MSGIPEYNPEGSDPNKMVKHPTFKDTYIVYCDSFVIGERKQGSRKQTKSIQVIGLFDKKENETFVEVSSMQHTVYEDPKIENVLQGLSNTIVPTHLLPNLMALLQNAYARVEEVKAEQSRGNRW